MSEIEFSQEQKQQLEAAEKERAAAEAAAKAEADERRVQQREAEQLREQTRQQTAQQVLAKELSALEMESAAPLASLLKLMQQEAGFQLNISESGDEISAVIDGNEVSLARALKIFSARNSMMFALRPDGAGIKKKPQPTREQLQAMTPAQKSQFIRDNGGDVYQAIITAPPAHNTNFRTMTAADWAACSREEKSRILSEVGTGADAWLNRLLGTRNTTSEQIAGVRRFK